MIAAVTAFIGTIGGLVRKMNLDKKAYQNESAQLKIDMEEHRKSTVSDMDKVRENQLGFANTQLAYLQKQSDSRDIKIESLYEANDKLRVANIDLKSKNSILEAQNCNIMECTDRNPPHKGVAPECAVCEIKKPKKNGKES